MASPFSSFPFIGKPSCHFPLPYDMGKATARGNRASKMHKPTEPQVSAHKCAKPGENSDNASVPRRGTTTPCMAASVALWNAVPGR